MNSNPRGPNLLVAMLCLGLVGVWIGGSRHERNEAANPRFVAQIPATAVAAPQPAAGPATASNPWDHWRGKLAQASRFGIGTQTPQSDAERRVAFTAFSNWLTLHKDPARAQAATDEAGVALAKSRRAAMARWIRDDPQFALEMAVSRDARLGLPAAVLAELETHVSGKGDFEVRILCGPQVSPAEQFRRTVAVDGATYEAFVYGRRLPQATKHEVPVHGIALEGRMALHESPVRQLEPIEARAAGLDPQVIPLHVGDRVMTAVNDRDAQAIEANLIARENGLGPRPGLAASGPSGPPGTSGFPPGTMAFPPSPGWTLGAKRILVIRIDFPDDTTSPVTIPNATTVMNTVSQFVRDNSQNQSSLTVSNIPTLVRMPQTKVAYAGLSPDVLRADALAAARTYDTQNGNTGAFNPDRYDLDMVAFTSIGGANYGFAGLAFVGAKGMWIHAAFDFATIAHELGHNYGLQHANRWDVTGTDPIDPNGTHNEYGDDYDSMGFNSFNRRLHFNEWFKAYLLWLPVNAGWRTASTGGVYRIFRHDSAVSTGLRGVTIGQQSDRAYWLGYRRQDPANTFLNTGLEIRWGMQPPGISANMTIGSRLLNMNPPVANFTQHPLPLGRTFADTNLNFFITPTATGGTFSNEFIDVNISYTIPPPSITQNPQSQTVIVGTNVTFTVGVTGTGPFTFQWFFNGTSLPGATSSNLTLVNVTTNQAGNYTVTVGNVAGSVTSSTAVLTVLVPPLISAQPQSQSVLVGTNVTFRVTATGTAPLRFQWDFNATPLPGATNSTLVLTNVQLAQAGNYSVLITNLAGATNSAVAVLTVTGGTGPPVIVQQPFNVLLPAPGLPASFFVTATGLLPLTYQWSQNGVPIPNATNSLLGLTNTQPSNAGFYNVTVANSLGTATSSNAFLTIGGPPQTTVFITPSNALASLGGSVTLSVTPPAGTIAIQWYRGTAPLGNPPGPLFPIAGATSATLVLANLAVTNSGAYSVQVGGDFGLFTSTPGGDAFVTVLPFVLTGSPAPLAHWRFDEDCGAVALDSAGVNHALFSATGASLVTNGVVGGALRLGRAANGFANAGRVLDFTNSPFTVVAWVKMTAGDTRDSVIASKHTPGTSDGYELGVNPDVSGLGQTNKARFYAGNTTNGPVSTTAINDGNWHQIVATYFPPVVTNILGLTIYVDGAPSEQATSSSFTASSARDFLLGGVLLNSTPTGAFDGLLDEVQVYDRILSDGEIDFLFRNPGLEAQNVPVAAPRPLAHWKFDEPGGTTAFDSAGTNNGVLSASGSSFVTTGISGGAISVLRSGNGFVNMGNVLQLTNTDYTISTWIRMNAGDRTDSSIVLSKQDAFISPNPGYFINVNTTTGPALALDKASFYDGSTVTFSATQSVISATSVNDGNWHQIVGVHRTGTFKAIYVDGSPVEATNAAQPAVATSVPLLIGGYNISGVPTGLFTGLIDEVQVYDRALTDTEIDFLFLNPGQGAQNITNTPPSPPVIVGQPQSRTTTAGADATFTVLATGSGPLRYQWLFNSLPLPGATSSNVTVTASQSVAGSYSVAVFNSAGSACSITATLTVNDPPVITTPPQSQVVAVGGTAVLGVIASGTAPLSYIWRKNGLNLPVPRISTLTLANAQASDAGAYDVVVYNNAGATLSAPATLTILGVPVISVQPQGQTVSVGASASFSVAATGAAPLAYQWRRNGTSIPGATGAAYSIASATAADPGSYTVVVSNAAGSVTSQPANLAFFGAPVITAHPVGTNVAAGLNVTFAVTATGTAPLSYQWLLNESVLPGATNATLVVPNAGIANEGAYRVVVGNAVGSVSSSTAVLVVTVPPVILLQPQSLSVPAAGTAIFSVVALGTAPPLTYQWRLNGTNIANATGSSLTINNVSPANLGLYSVVVTDGRGTVTSVSAQLSLSNANPEVILFDGSTVTNFHPRGFPALPVQWTIVPTNALEVAPATGDLDSFQLFNDFQLHVEFRTETPTNNFQSDVGIHLQGRYEIQIRESFGQTTLDSTNCGAIFGVRAPDVNASLPPGQWQSFDITFRSARWNGNTKIANARATVIQNGVLVQNDVEIPDRTFNANFETPTPGPIRLMGGSARVQYRNVRVTPLDVPPVFQFAVGAGSAGGDFVRGLARDASGNLYIAGTFSGSLALGSFAFNTAGGSDLFVAKLDPAGSVIWARQAGGPGDDFGKGVAVDIAGNVFAAGAFEGTAQFGTNAVTSTGSFDGFLAKYDRSGNLIWVRSGGGGGNDAAYAVGTDDAGNATIAGNFAGTANFGAVVLTSAGGLDSFVARYDFAGNPVWAVRHGGAGDNNTPGLRVEPSGVVYVAGSFPNTATFGFTQLTSRGSNDAFVAKLDNNGAFVWARQFGGPGDDFGNDVAFGPGGTVHLAGQFQGTLTNGSNILISLGASEAFVTKLDAGGAVQWTRQAGGISNDVAFGVAVDLAGNVFITGAIGGPANFSSTVVTNAGLDDLFVTKFDSAGTIQWVKTAGGTLANSGHRIELDAAGNAYLAGDFSGTWSLDSFPLVNAGGSDFFITKIGNAIANTVPPAIVLQPQSRAVAPGSSVTFTVSATGTQPLAYQWKRNGADIGGATVSTFNIPVVQPGDAGSYSVIVSNAAGAALSAPGVLTVIGPPFITLQPVPSQIVNPGETITLVVAATGTDPVGYIWRRGGANLNVPSLPSLVLNNIQPGDSGNYDVTVFNTAGVVVSSTATITVRPLPLILTPPMPQTVPQGGTASFSVSAGGTGSLTFQWRRDGQPVPGATGATLTLSNVQVSDTGLYVVVVTDTIGSISTLGVPLVVLVPPAVLLNPLAQMVVAGTNVQFTALFSGNPPPAYQWFRNGAVFAGATNTTLTLTNVTTNLAGLYTITATNLAGTAPSAGAQLVVVRSLILPPPPTPLSELQANGFTLSVVVEPGRIYRVQASTNLSTWTDIGFVVGSGGLVQSFLDRAASNRPNRFYRVVTP